MEKKGVQWAEFLVALMIAIAVLVIFIIVYGILGGRGVGLLEFIGDKWKFGRYGG